MKYLLLSTIALGLCCAPMAAEAQAQGQSQSNLNLGISTHHINANGAGSREELSGGGFMLTYVFGDVGPVEMALRSNFSILSLKEQNDINVIGTDLGLIFGQNLSRQGFKWYLGGGAYYELREHDTLHLKDSLTGIQLTSGVGYNWRKVALDLWLSARSVGAYEIDNRNVENVLTGGIALSVRF
ncbi:MAG: hypothetical protein JJU10_10780 [Idiomarina sp.]|nr:hypothetical protein [Idiomarina sp.]